MPVRILAAPFVLWLFVALGLTIFVDEGYSWTIIPAVVTLGMLYVFSPQIDWWWYKRNPPDLAEPLRLLLQKHYPFYQELGAEDKKRFRQRVALTLMAKDFKPQGIEFITEDIKMVVCAAEVSLTFGFEEFLLKRYENVVVYAGLFPSPKFPEIFHASEYFDEDGVLILAADHLLHGFLQPKLYYNIALHELANVFVISHPELSWPKFGPESWEKLEKISRFSKLAIEEWIKLPQGDPLPVSIHHFFNFPKAFQAEWPEVFEVLKKNFRHH